MPLKMTLVSVALLFKEFRIPPPPPPPELPRKVTLVSVGLLA